MKMNKDKGVLERFSDISAPQIQDDYTRVLKEKDEKFELAHSEMEVQPNEKRMGRLYQEAPISIAKQASNKIEVQHISEEEYRNNPVMEKKKETDNGRDSI